MNTQQDGINRFSVAEWQINVIENIAVKDGSTHTLRPKLVQLLKYLAQNRNRVVSKQAIMAEIWGDTVVDAGIIKNSISTLRTLLGDDSKKNLIIILTIARRGYQLIAPVDFSHNQKPLKDQNIQTVPVSPFRGLEVFEYEHQAAFFGQQNAINAILKKLNPSIDSSNGFCLIVGASGTGKSSLAQAGVIPQLVKQEHEHNWLRVIFGSEFYGNDIIHNFATGIIKSLSSLKLSTETLIAEKPCTSLQTIS